MLLRITEKAAKQIAVSINSGGMQGMGLRIAAQRRADGTIEYAMGFDEPNDTDTHSRQHEIDIIIAPTRTELLSGAILDFDMPENEKESQFIFLNPNDPSFEPPSSEHD